MSDHYHDPADLRFLKQMGKLAPNDFNAWLNLDKIVGREDGAIPRKYYANSSLWLWPARRSALTA